MNLEIPIAVYRTLRGMWQRAYRPSLQTQMNSLLRSFPHTHKLQKTPDSAAMDRNQMNNLFSNYFWLKSHPLTKVVQKTGLVVVHRGQTYTPHVLSHSANMIQNGRQWFKLEISQPLGFFENEWYEKHTQVNSDEVLGTINKICDAYKRIDDVYSSEATVIPTHELIMQLSKPFLQNQTYSLDHEKIDILQTRTQQTSRPIAIIQKNLFWRSHTVSVDEYVRFAENNLTAIADKINTRSKNKINTWQNCFRNITAQKIDNCITFSTQINSFVMSIDNALYEFPPATLSYQTIIRDGTICILSYPYVETSDYKHFFVYSDGRICYHDNRRWESIGIFPNTQYSCSNPKIYYRLARMLDEAVRTLHKGYKPDCFPVVSKEFLDDHIVRKAKLGQRIFICT